MTTTADLTGLMSRTQLRSVAKAQGRVNIWDGSIRSGKTISSLFAWLLYVATAPHGGELVMIGRTRDAIGRNVLGPLQDETLFGPLAKVVKYTYGAPKARIYGRTIHVIGASDAKAEKTIRGMTVAGSYVDEVTVLQEEFFTQLLGRMSVPGAKLFGTTNPDSPAHWLKVRFLDRIAELDGWARFHFTLRDNPSLTPEYVAQVSSEYTGLWHKRFILGEWVAAEGAIFSMWDPDRHVIPWQSLPSMQRIVGVGIDYGTTNATAALMLGLGADGVLYLVDEWRHDPAQTSVRLTDAQLSERMRAWLAESHLPQDHQPRPEWTVADPAAASFRVQLHNDGLTTQPADNDVAYGIRTVPSLLGDGLLKVSDRCKGWITEAPGYSWDPKATERGEDKPIKVADHSLDGGRYAVVTTEPLWRGSVAAGG